jgi:glycosyltransferase involved in cell wall biosynthesis
MVRSHTYSVVIPTFNRYAECLAAVRSVFAQTAPPQEVVVIDDANLDERYQWLEDIVCDPRLTIIRLEENSRVTHGVGYAIGAVRNWGLRYILSGVACPQWIAFLDDDDEWIPEKMERCFAVADEYENHRLICTNAINRRPDGTHCGYHHGDNLIQPDGEICTVNEELMTFNPVICSTAMIGADIARQVGDQRDTGFGEDWDYWQRAARLTQGIMINEPLAYYTIGNSKNYQY